MAYHSVQTHADGLHAQLSGQWHADGSKHGDFRLLPKRFGVDEQAIQVKDGGSHALPHMFSGTETISQVFTTKEIFRMDQCRLLNLLHRTCKEDRPPEGPKIILKL